MIVTNGTNLTDAFLIENQGYLDWITLSVDSLIEESNYATGRAISGKRVVTKTDYYELVNKIKQFGYGLKINTVVSKINASEVLIDFIKYANPKRWKLFQVLPIEGQNDNKVDKLLISDEQFRKYIERNKIEDYNIEIVPEYNNQMLGSYVGLAD